MSLVVPSLSGFSTGGGARARPVWAHRYARFNVTGRGPSNNNDGTVALTELALLNVDGTEINNSAYGTTILSHPVAGNFGDIIDGQTQSGGGLGIGMPWAQPLVMDLGAGRGVTPIDSIKRLVLWPIYYFADDATLQSCMPSSFTVDGANDPAGPWTNFLTIVADDVTVGYGHYNATAGKSFPFPA